MLLTDGGMGGFKEWVVGGMGGRCVRCWWICRRKDGHKGGVKGPLLMKQKKREKLRCLLLHRRKNFFFNIYDVIVKQKKRKRSANHYWRGQRHTHRIESADM